MRPGSPAPRPRWTPNPGARPHPRPPHTWLQDFHREMIHAAWSAQVRQGTELGEQHRGRRPGAGPRPPRRLSPGPAPRAVEDAGRRPLRAARSPDADSGQVRQERRPRSAGLFGRGRPRGAVSCQTPRGSRRHAQQAEPLTRPGRLAPGFWAAAARIPPRGRAEPGPRPLPPGLSGGGRLWNPRKLPRRRREEAGAPSGVGGGGRGARRTAWD